MKNKEIIIFTDGASRGNPGPGGYGSIIVFQGKVVEIGGREGHTTNNRMELTAAIKALEFIKLHFYTLNPIPYTLIFYTDSSYVINGITKWIYLWQKRNWITKNKEPVLNKDLWEILLELVKSKKINWENVPGHAGVPGNERADQIATLFALGKKPELYSGSFSKYKIHILDLDPVSSKTKHTDRAVKARTRAKAHSYLSEVKGVIKKHKTWVECEKRVKGVSSAKFKKALNIEEEKEIIKEWKK